MGRKCNWKSFIEKDFRIFVIDTKTEVANKAVVQKLEIVNNFKDLTEPKVYNLIRVVSPFEFLLLHRYEIITEDSTITGLQDIANGHEDDGVIYYPRKDIKVDKKENKYECLLKDSSKPFHMSNGDFLYEEISFSERMNVDILSIIGE